jgi:MFS family permease
VSPTFASLQVHNYRLWAVGALVSNTGTWMQRVAQDWLVLTVLTDHSAVAVGITTGLQFGPMLVLGPFAGLVADRLPKRRVLMTTQFLMGFWSLLLGLLVVTGSAELWHVFVLAGMLGVTAAVDAPARQTFVAEMVPEDKLSNAVGLNSASFHAGRLLGPAVAGLLIALVGTGPVFLVNAATFMATLLSLAGMRLRELRPMPRAPREKGQVREGLRYVRDRPDIMLVMAIVGMVGTFGLNFQMTTALMATSVYDKGAGQYGLLGSIMAIGSLAGALLAARRARPRLRLLVGATAAFGVLATVSALMPTYELFALSLIPVGLSSLTLMTAANTMVQLATDPEMRGRVMSLYMAIFMGGTPIGAPLIGLIGEHFGARWTILLGGVVSMVVAVVATAYVVRSRRLRLRYRPLARPRLVVESPATRRADVQRRLAAEDVRDASAA